jgi:hypothetical protein
LEAPRRNAPNAGCELASVRDRIDGEFGDVRRCKARLLGSRFGQFVLRVLGLLLIWGVCRSDLKLIIVVRGWSDYLVSFVE